MTWKRGPHEKEKKSLSIKGLLAVVSAVFEKVASAETGNNRQKNISLSDCLMSALAMFSLKSPSLLAFDVKRFDPVVSHNLKTLYKIEHVPSDTYMRQRLDEVDPKHLHPCYTSVFQEVQKGKLLERYKYLGGYLCLLDGSEIFNSENVHCMNCCEKHHKDGRITYHHQILGAVIAHPDHRQVIPLCPEPIIKQDGETKNDCERNAAYRFLHDLKREHPRLQLTIVSDALSANAPYINELKALGYNYIISITPEGNRTLYDYVRGITKEIVMTVGKNQYRFRYVNDVPLNDTKNAPNVNFFECEATEIEGKRTIKRTIARITGHEITKNNIYDLLRGGRARWKVENETFNTLKNQGYQFEHNFGHGQKNLHTVFALLMMLAFCIDQIQEATCGLFQAALKRFGARRTLWEMLRSFFHVSFIESWQVLWKSMSGDYKAFMMCEDTC
jgi:hypothetical protein